MDGFVADSSGWIALVRVRVRRLALFWPTQKDAPAPRDLKVRDLEDPCGCLALRPVIWRRLPDRQENLLQQIVCSSVVALCVRGHVAPEARAVTLVEFTQRLMA